MRKAFNNPHLYSTEQIIHCALSEMSQISRPVSSEHVST